MSLLNVKVIKLVTGEELISQCEINDKELILKNPVMIGMTKDGQTGLMPWAPFVDSKTIHISKSNVIYTETPIIEVVNGYNQQFGSGIVTANAGDMPRNNVSDIIQ